MPNQINENENKTLGDEINRRYYLAHEVIKVLPELDGPDPESSQYNLIAEAAGNITYGKYRYLLALCYQKQNAILLEKINELINNHASNSTKKGRA